MTLKLKVLPAFPASINGGTGIDATKTNGAVTVDMDWSEFGTISAIPTSPTSNILTFDTATGAYVMVPSHLMGGAVSGIADAPTDGNQYGRQNTGSGNTWTPVTSSFIQAGTGAVTRTMQDKARERISVLDFGVVGDGATDNFTALRNAINAASGKELYFPPGNYIVTLPSAVNFISLGANSVLRGAGKGNTSLTFNALGYDNIIMFNCNSPGIEFHNLTVNLMPNDGSWTPNGLILFGVAADRLTFQDCHFNSNNYDGIFIGGTVTGGNIITVVFTSTGVGGSPVSVSYTVIGGNTLAQIAAGLANAINSIFALTSAGLTALATGAFVGIKQATLNPKAVFTATVSGSATETATVSTSNDTMLWLVSGNANDFSAINCDVSNFNWVVIKTNTTTFTNQRWKFIGGRYDNNAQGHVNINSPSGIFRDVLITGLSCGETSPNAQDGFGVALSRVAGARIIGNSFFGTYNQNVIHVEEGSNILTIEGNSIVRDTSASFGDGYRGTAIFLTDSNISGSYLGNSSVVISNNTIVAWSINNSGYGIFTNVVSTYNTSMMVLGNSIAGFHSGLFLPGSSNYTITGNLITAYDTVGTGIIIGFGPGVISGNVIRVYPTTINNAAADDVRIMDNYGYNPVGAAGIAPGASPFSYTAGASPETIYLAAGSITSILCNGIEIMPAATSINVTVTVPLGPYEVARISYTGSLSARKMVH